MCMHVLARSVTQWLYVLMLYQWVQDYAKKFFLFFFGGGGGGGGGGGVKGSQANILLA